MVAIETEQEQLRFGLTTACIADIQQVLGRSPRLEKAVLFGSRAMATYKNGSDIDLALQGEKLVYDDIIALYGQLDELPYAYTYDLIDYNKISNSAVKAHIDDLGIIFYEKEQSLLPTGWKECKLDDLGVILNYKRIPLNSREREVRKGIHPYYGASGIVDYIDDFIFEGEHVLISEDGENLRSRQTPIAFKANGKFWVNNHAHIFKGNNNVINDYVVYFFQNLDINPFITGAVQPKLNKENLLSISIKLPAENELVQMVEILRSLDDKIELNRQMNQTLEAIAQTLFTEWFIRFNFPGFDGELVDGLPRDWLMGDVDDLFELQRGFDLPATTRTEGHFPVVAASGISTYHNQFKVKGPGVTTGRSGVIGNVYYIVDDFWPLNTSLFIKEYKIATPLFAYHVLRDLQLVQLNGGSAVPTLNRNDVHRLSVVVPNKKIIEEFEKIAESLFDKRHKNEKEIQTLTQLRDSLLPKLMSGQIQVGADA